MWPREVPLPLMRQSRRSTNSRLWWGFLSIGKARVKENPSLTYCHGCCQEVAFHRAAGAIQGQWETPWPCCNLASDVIFGIDEEPVTRLSSCTSLAQGLNTRRQKPWGPLKHWLTSVLCKGDRKHLNLIYHQYLHPLLISASISSFIQTLYFHRKKNCHKVLCNTLGSGSALEQSFQALPLKVRNTEILSSPAPLSVYPTRYMAPWWD